MAFGRVFVVCGLVLVFLLHNASAAGQININFANLLQGAGAGGPNDAPTVAQLQKQVADLTAANNKMKRKLSLMGFNEPNEYAPIPTKSLAEGVRSDGMVLKELGAGTGVWFVSDTAYNSAIIDIGTSVIVVDAPPTYSEERLKSVVAEVAKNRTVSHFIYTHTHNDHVGLAGAFASTAQYLSHPLTVDLLKRNPRLPLPTVTLPNNTVWTAGNKRFEFYYYETAHSEGSLLIWLPEQKVAIYIDIVFPQWVPFYALGITQDSYRYKTFHDDLLAINFDYLISGHLGRVATRADVEKARQYLTDLTIVIGETYAKFPFGTYYQIYAGPPVHWWAILHNWEADMATECSRRMIEKYTGDLAGVDVYAWTHCWHMREAIDLFSPMEGGKRKKALKIFGQ